jgi:hypothetical protein
MFSFWEGGRAGSILGITDEHINNSLEALWGGSRFRFRKRASPSAQRAKKKEKSSRVQKIVGKRTRCKKLKCVIKNEHNANFEFIF